jgi:hypothetical protein
MAANTHPYRKLGLGLAVVAVPVGAALTAFSLHRNEERRNAALEKNFNYDNDLLHLRQVDPALVKWQELTAIDVQLAAPTCFAVAPGGQIVVGADRQFRILSSRGEPLHAGKLPAAATAIAADAQRLYIATRDRILLFARDGKALGEWAPLASGSHITSIAVSGDAIYVADAGRRVGRLLKFSLDGNFLRELAKRDPARDIPGIITPSSHMNVALAADGNVWVANPGRHQLELYSPEGELLRHWGSAGTTVETFLGCCNPSDFALLADGRLVTAEKGVARVKVFAEDGHFDAVVAPPAVFGGNRAGIDLAADSAGRVLLLEPGTHTIRVFAPRQEAK